MHHDSCTFIFDFMETYPLTFSYNVIFLPPIILSVSWMQLSVAAVCIYSMVCAWFLSDFTSGCAPTCHILKKKSMCYMVFCTVSCCSSHQLLPGAVLLVWWKVFGNLLCVFWVFFSDSHLKLAELKPMASNSSSTPSALQFLFFCLQLEMKALHFFPPLPIMASFLLPVRHSASKQWPTDRLKNFLTPWKSK